jgi:hypothetical protein
MKSRNYINQDFLILICEGKKEYSKRAKKLHK